jgi:hypothetical protein
VSDAARNGSEIAADPKAKFAFVRYRRFFDHVSILKMAKHDERDRSRMDAIKYGTGNDAIRVYSSLWHLPWRDYATVSLGNWIPSYLLDGVWAYSEVQILPNINSWGLSIISEGKGYCHMPSLFASHQEFGLIGGTFRTSEPYIRALILPEVVAGHRQGVNASSIDSCLRGFFGETGLLPDFHQCIIHRLGLLAGITGVADKDDKRDDFNPGSWISHQLPKVVSIDGIIKTSKQISTLFIGLLCLLIGYVMSFIKLDVDGSITRNFSIRIIGVGLLFCAQRCLWFFLDLIN